MAINEFENVGEYRTDDVDQYRDEPPPTLRIFQGGNGDWYVAIAPEGHRLAPRSSVVRVTTSGVRVQGLGPAIAAAFRALVGRPDIRFSLLDMWQPSDAIATLEGAMAELDREASKLEAAAMGDPYPKSPRVRQKKARAAELRALRTGLDALAAPLRVQRAGH